MNDQPKLPQTDPEQLMKMLELELAAKRPKSHSSTASRDSFRLWSILILVFGTIAALVFLQYMLSQIAPVGTSSAPQETVAPAPNP
jgi:hypothetical protein